MASVATYPDELGHIKQLKFTCTSDGSGDSTGISKKIRGVIQRVIIIPGTNVSANYTVKILDANGVDVLQSDGNTGIICPSATDKVELRPVSHICDVLTCTLAAVGATKIVTIIIYWSSI